MSERVCHLVDLGRMAHEQAEALQERLVAQVRTGDAPDTLLLVEHDPVVTLGRAVDEPAAEVALTLLESAGASVRHVSRGGRATFHGPGQIVGYPIIDLRRHRTDLHWYLRSLEQVIIDTLDGFGYHSGRVDGYTGVWIGARKVASIGIAVRGWITWHGFALNLDVDPSWWHLIDPCGLRPEQMASLRDLATQTESRAQVCAALAASFSDRFGLSLRRVEPVELLAGPGF